MNQSRLPIFGLLLKPKYFIVYFLVFTLIFYANHHLMVTMPGGDNFMCEIGGGLTPGNMFFGFFMSVMAGLTVIGFIENSVVRSKLSKVKLGTKFKLGSTSFLGLGLGTLTTFCTFCSLPALTLLGSSVSLSFFADYELYIKIASLVFLVLGFYFVNKELKEGCQRCVA